jgi:hypothetical protein
MPYGPCGWRSSSHRSRGVLFFRREVIQRVNGVALGCPRVASRILVQQRRASAALARGLFLKLLVDGKKSDAAAAEILVVAGKKSGKAKSIVRCGLQPTFYRAGVR